MFATVALYWPPRERPIKKEAEAEVGAEQDVADAAADTEALAAESVPEADQDTASKESPEDVTPKPKEKKDGFLAWTLGGDILEVMRRASPAAASTPVVEAEEDVEAKLQILENLVSAKRPCFPCTRVSKSCKEPNGRTTACFGCPEGAEHVGRSSCCGVWFVYFFSLPI